MYLAKIIGTVVSTSKREELIGMKLMIVERLNEHLESSRETEVAVDAVGAGEGEIVIVCKGSSARHVFGDRYPIDTTIIAIVDTVEVG